MLDNESTQTTISRFLLAAALLCGCGLMWPVLRGAPPVIDEHVSYWIAAAGNPGTVYERSLNYAATPPLSSWLQRGCLELFGDHLLAFRASSVACYLLAIGFTFCAGRELRDNATGAIAAAIVAWHPDVIDDVRVARPYALSLALSALSIWITIRWSRQPNRGRLCLSWIVANAALVWTHYVNVPLVMLELVVLALFARLRLRNQPRPTWMLPVAVFALGALSLPLVPSVLRLWEWSPQLNYRQAPASFSELVGPLWWIGLPLGLLVGIVIRTVSGKIRKQTAHRPEANLFGDAIAMFTLAVVPLTLLFVISQGDLTSLANSRYRIVYAPAAAVFIAVCLIPRRSMTAACAGMLVVVIATWSLQDHLPWHSRHFSAPAAPDWIAMAREIESNGNPGEPLFVQSGLIESNLVPALFDDETFMDYVSCRLGRFALKSKHRRFALPMLWLRSGESREFFQRLLDECCRSNIRTLWVAGGTDTDLSRASMAEFNTLLKSAGFQRIQVVRKQTAVLARYECMRTQPTP